jgi:hypothetical protein
LLEGQDVKFTKEPDYGTVEVVRGVVRVGPGESATGFAWLRDTALAPKDQQVPGEAVKFIPGPGWATVVVDHNRNLDLTDDPFGVFSERLQPGKIGIGAFVGVPRGEVRVPYATRIWVHSGSGYPAQLLVSVNSGWVGAVELGGKRWRLAVVDDVDGVLEEEDLFVLTPHADQEPDYEDPDDPWRLPLPHRLLLDGVLYKIAYKFEKASKWVDLVVTFTEIERPMGELAIESPRVSHLMLQQGEGESVGLAVFERPGDTVQIPAGPYQRQRMYLDGGEAQGAYIGTSTEPLTVIAGTATPLGLGAPLQPSVEASRDGRDLRIRFKLAGIGGEPYKRLLTEDLYAALHTDPRTKPRVAIRRGDRELVSGNFEYG